MERGGCTPVEAFEPTDLVEKPALPVISCVNPPATAGRTVFSSPLTHLNWTNYWTNWMPWLTGILPCLAAIGRSVPIFLGNIYQVTASPAEAG